MVLRNSRNSIESPLKVIGSVIKATHNTCMTFVEIKDLITLAEPFQFSTHKGK